MPKSAKTIVLIALMTACLSVAKQVLAIIPNVEGVSLLIAIFSATFGYIAIIPTVLFVLIEILIWGMNTWVLGYLIYWPLLCVVWCVIFSRERSRLVSTLTIVGMTILFGVITSLVEVGLFSGTYDDFFVRFLIYYGRGIVFYVIHVVSNAIIFWLLYEKLRRFVIKQKDKYFSS